MRVSSSPGRSVGFGSRSLRSRRFGLDEEVGLGQRDDADPGEWRRRGRDAQPFGGPRHALYEQRDRVRVQSTK